MRRPCTASRAGSAIGSWCARPSSPICPRTSRIACRSSWTRRADSMTPGSRQSRYLRTWSRCVLASRESRSTSRGPRWLGLAEQGDRAKMRCGGERTPAVAELACVRRRGRRPRSPFKATAGLHHAVRTGEQHGFLNLLAAATFGYEEGALAETDPPPSPSTLMRSAGGTGRPRRRRLPPCAASYSSRSAAAASPSRSRSCARSGCCDRAPPSLRRLLDHRPARHAPASSSTTASSTSPMPPRAGCWTLTRRSSPRRA